MSDEARQAKAEAKAAKAKAKSLRPFYKKKRFILLAAVVLIAIIAISSGGGSDSSESSDAGASSGSGSSSDTIGKGLGSADASGDIVDLECGSPDAIGMTYPKVTVKNNSSKASDYFITVVAESPDGSTRYDDTTVFISGLGPDQTMTEEGMFTNELPEGAICKVTEVQRTAS